MVENSKAIPVKVALRIRPLVPRELAMACNECLRCPPGAGGTQVVLGKDKAFTYDYVFDQKAPQLDLYEMCAKQLLTSLFKGYNATVLAYGQTGSGKTFTMGSGYSSLTSAVSANKEGGGEGDGGAVCLDTNGCDEVGVIPRVLNDLFLQIDEEKAKCPNDTFSVSVSFVEVYNEEIKDLFTTSSESLNIREENNSIKVVGLSEISVNSALSTIQLLERGSSQRVVGGTAMNDQSSRSHAIFTISLEQRRVLTEGATPDLIASKFHLVDLAGSERQSKTKAEGIRLREGININLGLLALGNVISVLGEEAKEAGKARHVPYRESKLTRLLQDSLGGNSHTLMVACVSPADSNMEETLNTLRYADRARKIKNKPIVNIDPQAAKIAAFQQEIQDLKTYIYKITGSAPPPSEIKTSNPSIGGPVSSSGPSVSSVENQKTVEELKKSKTECGLLKAENNKLLVELQRLISTHRVTYARLTQLQTEKEEEHSKMNDEILPLFNKLCQASYKKQKKGDGNGDDEKMEEEEEANQNKEEQDKENNSNQKLIIDELKVKLADFDAMKINRSKNEEDEENDEENDKQKTETDNENENETEQPVVDKEFAFRQAKMQCQLTEYDSELQKKQILFQKMMGNNMNSIKEANEANMSELKSKIESLEKEKETLAEMVRAGAVSSSSSGGGSNNEIAKAKRDRLKALEHEVADLKRKEREYGRMATIKKENDKHCEKLRQEICHIKQERVRLMKQMKTDTDAFRKYKSEKEREVTQLKALERKRMVEISKLQEGKNRHANVLRRKNEEIHRITRQLRETSEKQKQVAEKRQQAFDKRDLSQAGEKLRNWIIHEVELSVGLAEARLSLQELLADRSETADEKAQLLKQLDELRLEEEENNSSRKKSTASAVMDATYVTGVGGPGGPTGGSDEKNNDGDDETEEAVEKDDEAELAETELRKEERARLEQRIARCADDIECKTMQINEIQQMVIEGGEQDDRSKHLFNSMHGMLEAKVVLKHLFTNAVQYLLDLKMKQNEHTTSIQTMKRLRQELQEVSKSSKQFETEVRRSKRLHTNEVNELHKHYQNRILVELAKKLNDPDASQDQIQKILYEKLKDLEMKYDAAGHHHHGHAQSQAQGDHVFKEPSLHSMMVRKRTTPLDSSGMSNAQDREDYRRKQRAKREHRRTRIIRTVPVPAPTPVPPPPTFASSTPAIAIESGSAAEDTPNVQSPMPGGGLSPNCASGISGGAGHNSSSYSPFPWNDAPTPEDKRRDPDWSKTPLRVKQRNMALPKRSLLGAKLKNRVSRNTILLKPRASHGGANETISLSVGPGSEDNDENAMPSN